MVADSFGRPASADQNRAVLSAALAEGGFDEAVCSFFRKACPEGKSTTSK